MRLHRLLARHHLLVWLLLALALWSLGFHLQNEDSPMTRGSRDSSRTMNWNAQHSAPFSISQYYKVLSSPISQKKYSSRAPGACSSPHNYSVKRWVQTKGLITWSLCTCFCYIRQVSDSLESLIRKDGSCSTTILRSHRNTNTQILF